MAAGKKETCCFTGHRPQKLPWGGSEEDPRCQMLKTAMAESIADAYWDGYRVFLCGMALGADLWFCEEALRWKEQLPNLRLHAVLPCEGQAQRWSEQDRNRYYGLLERCDQVITLQTAFTPDCMQRRNRYMVDHSSLLIAAYTGTFGGTMQTVGYAMTQGLEVRYLSVPK